MQENQLGISGLSAKSETSWGIYKVNGKHWSSICGDCCWTVELKGTRSSWNPEFRKAAAPDTTTQSRKLARHRNMESNHYNFL